MLVWYAAKVRPHAGFGGELQETQLLDISTYRMARTRGSCQWAKSIVSQLSDESSGQVTYLVESNKLQVRANAGGDEAKRERKFLFGMRVDKSSLFGRSSHGTGVERTV
jgi:hypothetical protein